MKCPHCSNNHPRRKSGMRCSCGYLFVFDPQSDTMRDGRMSSLINKVSANNTRFFTLNLLYGTVLRQAKINKGCLIIAFVVSLLLIGIPFLISSWNEVGDGIMPVFLGLLLLFFTGVAYLFQHFSKPMSFSDFSHVFKRWQQYSTLKSDKFIDKTTLHNPPPKWNENDIYHYGVEKVIILDNDLSVDLWIKNNEHVNQKALILASSGYPNYLIGQLRTILAQQTDIEIFSLHGLRTTLHREAMRFQKASDINLENYNFIDLGFSKKQIQKSKLLNHTYRTQNYDIPLDMLPYASGINMLAWANHSFAQNQHSLSNGRRDFDVDVDFDDFDFG
ncbi:MAG: hypothetical protein GQ569_05185 [Methylococcaceae bacterium]|nr:hypothetical protein [Methylococcaceae bacterium]